VNATPELVALNFRKVFKGGSAQPQVFLCRRRTLVPASQAASLEADEHWVLKLMGSVPSIELAADGVGSCFAKMLGVPCPCAEVCEVDLDALTTAPADVRVWAQPGPAFASEWLVNTKNPASLYDLSRVSNSALFARLHVLDAWLEVLDRRKPDGSWNLLIDTTTSSGTFVAIDFGKSLTPCFGQVISGAQWIDNFPAELRELKASTELAEGLRLLSDMLDADISSVVDAIPAAWINEKQRQAVRQFLLDRRPKVAGRLAKSAAAAGGMT